MVPGKGQQSVAEVLILEHSDDKDLFFFPGLIDIPEVQLPGIRTLIFKFLLISE